MAAATEPASGSSQTSPRFLTLGDGNEVLQVALGPGDEVFATERSFVYRGLGLRQELHRTAERGALGRALGWVGLKNDKVVKWINEGRAPTYIGLCAPMLGKIVPVNLRQTGPILVKPHMFLCSVRDNDVSTRTLRLTLEGPFSVYNTDCRKVSGSGMCYIQTGGAAVQKVLVHGESMWAEMGCLVAFSESCKVVAEQRPGVLREPPYSQGFNVRISGPGTVFLQSSHVGRISHSMWMERLVHRASGTAGDFVKVALMVAACFFMVIALIPDNAPP